MSIHYDSTLVVGWILSDEDDLPKKFRKHYEETSHEEDRFDSKTGQWVSRVSVVDSDERDVYILDGREYEMSCDFFEALAKKIDAVIMVENDSVYIEPKNLTNPIKVKDFTKLIKKLTVLRCKLLKLGFKLGEPVVASQLIEC